MRHAKNVVSRRNTGDRLVETKDAKLIWERFCFRYYLFHESPLVFVLPFLLFQFCWIDANWRGGGGLG